MLKKLCLFLNGIQGGLGGALLDCVSIFVGLLFDSDSVLGSLGFEFCFFLSDFLQAVLLEIVDVGLLNSDGSSELLEFSSLTFALSFESNSISGVLSASSFARLFSLVLLGVLFEVPVGNFSSFSLDLLLEKSLSGINL